MLKDLVMKNRSYRGFDESFRFSREELLELVDLTRYTASSVNEQPLKYYIAFEKEEVEQILPLTMWARALKDTQLPHSGMGPSAFIIICQDMNISANTTRFQRDVGIAAQTILLAAVEKGLGGCMIGSFRPDRVAAAFHIPERYAPTLVVALGKPDEEITLVPVGEDGDIRYYRDENGHHFVPKRSLEEILIK